MNIFFLDQDPKVSATRYVRTHCNKIPLEIAQMVSTAFCTYNQPALYRSTHRNHPMTKWVTASRGNCLYALQIGLACCHEYTSRHQVVLKVQSILEDLLARIDDCSWLSTDLEVPPLCDGSNTYLSNWNDLISGYQAYYERKLAGWAGKPNLLRY